MSRHIVDDEQRRDRPQPPCARRVSSGAGHLRRWRSSTMRIGIACVAPPCIYPAPLETRPLLILGQAPSTRGLSLLFFGFCDVLCLQAFWAPRHRKGYRFSFSQRSKAAHLNSRMMNEYVSACGSFNKPIAFGIVKPLHFPSFFFHFHWNSLLLLPFLQIFLMDGSRSANEKAAIILAAVTRSGPMAILLRAVERCQSKSILCSNLTTARRRRSAR